MQTLTENEMTTVLGGQVWSGRKPSNVQPLSTDEMTTISGGGRIHSI